MGSALWMACALTLAAAPFARAQDAPPTLAPAPETNTEARRTIGTIERALLDAGLENVTVEPGKGLQIAYENRRYRHSAFVLGLARAATGEPVLVGERRLGLLSAALQPLELGPSDEFRVLYPSDAWFPAAPRGAFRSPTFRRMDLEVGPRVDYRVGQIFDPFQARFELEPRLRLNPWPGAHVRLGLVVPLQDDFEASPDQPDADQVRPGRMSLDQFAWIPGLSLVSFSGGYFGENRWGFSAGAARPLAQGTWLLDAQVDHTGFLAFMRYETLYSELDRTSGFAGVTYRPPFADVALRLRGGQFLHGDRGGELEVKRTFGDLDVAYFVQHTGGDDVFGMRIDLPVPPLTRESGSAVRVQPAPRFQLDFHDQGAPIGAYVSGVASREDFLRQLSRPALEANAARYRRAADGTVPSRATSDAAWVSFAGMTGFVHTPWAGVLADRRFDVGYNFIPRRWSYDHRGTNDNQVFYMTLGFLPRLETAIRWTRIPGYRSFQEIVPDSRLVDMDRMASGRLMLFAPAERRPGLAVGVEDAVGFRRFHSTYAVAGMPLTVAKLPTRWSVGYGFRLVDPQLRTLDGLFGAGEIAMTRWSRVQLEYDSEKWNAGLGLAPGWGVQIRTALLNLESLAVGASWSHPL